MGLVALGNQLTVARPAPLGMAGPTIERSANVTAVIHLAISRDNLLSSNMRIHWATKARATKAIREMAFVMCQHARPARMHAATCDITVRWPDNRQRDALNLEPTIKACLDGIIGDRRNNPCSYMLLPSDSDLHLRKVSTSASPERLKTPGIAAYLTFTFEEVSG